MCRWIAVGLITLLAGCATVKIQHDSDPNANFASFEKFSWISDFPLIAPENDLLIEYRSQAVEYLRTGQVSRSLRRSEHFEDLVILARCDLEGRVPGAPVAELDAALDYVFGLSTAWDDV